MVSRSVPSWARKITPYVGKMVVLSIGPLAAVGCITAYLFSGHTGIYHAQRLGRGKHSKHRRTVPEELRISDLAHFHKQRSEAQKKPPIPPADTSEPQIEHQANDIDQKGE